MNVEILEEFPGSLIVIFADDGRAYDWGFRSQFGEYMRIEDGDTLTVYDNGRRVEQYKRLSFGAEGILIQGAGFSRTPQVHSVESWANHFQNGRNAALLRTREFL